MTAPTKYVVDGKALSDEMFGRAFTALLNAYAPNLSHASVDIVTAGAELPAPAKEAFDQLTDMVDDRAERPRGWLRRVFTLPSDPRMDVELDLRSKKELELFDAFAPFSIHAEVYVDDRATPVMTIDDGVTLIFEADSHILDLITHAGVSRDSIEELVKPHRKRS